LSRNRLGEDSAPVSNPEFSEPEDSLSVIAPVPDGLQVDSIDSDVGFSWEWEGPTRTEHFTPGKIVDTGYLAFVDAVLSDDCSFYQLNRNIFVVNGWNHKKKEPSVRKSELGLREALSRLLTT
jgi:hypothetical protein